MLSGLVHYTLRTILKLSGGIIIWILNENYSLSDCDHIIVVREIWVWSQMMQSVSWNIAQVGEFYMPNCPIYVSSAHPLRALNTYSMVTVIKDPWLLLQPGATAAMYCHPEHDIHPLPSILPFLLVLNLF